MIEQPDIPARPGDCPATVRHTHGVTTCRLPAGHPNPDQHEGRCWGCFEDGESDDISWTGGPGRTDWLTKDPPP